MRPQDIVILLKILANHKKDWQYRDLANELVISISEVSESLNRSHIAGLIDESKRRVHRESLLEFIQHGLHYVFPQVPGTFVTGIPTGHSHPFFKDRITAELEYVWPHDQGTARGLSIAPLYKGAPVAVGKDKQLYKWLACIDVIRVGRAREKKLAVKELEKELMV
ncbi:MAG: hypothetical protein FGM46_08330 [Ferruginibacter sp.]|nr:hypothetical protein [Ferruginibacter sp.]